VDAVRGNDAMYSSRARFKEGDAVQTPFGKGVVREVRNNRRLLVDVHDRALVVGDDDVTAIAGDARRSHKAGPADRKPDRGTATAGSASVAGARPVDIDLHGLTVEEALARVESALNEALLADHESLRLIHGRSGGKIRAALHRRLREIPSVRGFRIDPRNEGVTIVSL